MSGSKNNISLNLTSDLKTHYRSHHCGALRKKHIGRHVTLCGWIRRYRRMGAILWMDLRDRYGITQLVFEGKSGAHLDKSGIGFGREALLQIKGEVIARVSPNPNLPTGDIEVRIVNMEEDMTVLATFDTTGLPEGSDGPPFLIEDKTDGGEELRLRHRYLDLRRATLQRNLRLRHKICRVIRDELDAHDFIEVETPMLVKSTPEGARDFVVPYQWHDKQQVHRGDYYALPQSPQIFKQLLMIGGLDRYYQIVRCFRDEDLRADRQPEFTQLDCEMAFVQQEDVLNCFEGLVCSIFRQIKGVDLGPFPRLTWREAMARYGTDKPDLRFGLQATHLTELVQGHGFEPFDTAEAVWGMCVKGQAAYSRKQLDALADFVRSQQIKGKGLVYVKLQESGITSSVRKHYTDDQINQWVEKMKAKTGDLLLLVFGNDHHGPRGLEVQRVFSALRTHVADTLGLCNPDKWTPLWITDFPLFAKTEDGFGSLHHPFTAAQASKEQTDRLAFIGQELKKLKKNQEIPASLQTEALRLNAQAYDMVVNGVEIGGGSIRITDTRVQQTIFRLLGLGEAEIKARFGFLLDALRRAAPPHGGIAFGLDRICMLLANAHSLRDVIAFPKNSAGRDTMMGAPAPLPKTHA